MAAVDKASLSKRLLTAALVMAVGFTLVILGGTSLQSLGALISICGACLALGAVWFFLRSSGRPL
jgi:hypothetical protein